MSKNTEAAVVALATADATSNMTALQRAAHDVVSGSKLATKGRVAMTFELASLILAEEGTTVTFTHDKETFTRPLIAYLLGEEEGGKKNNKRLFAFWAAIRDNLLGTDVADDSIVRSAFVACLRSAAGVAGLAEDGSSAVSLTKDGANVVLRAGHALTLQDDAGNATKAGKAVFEEAARREKTRAEIKAELTSEDVPEPTEAEIWAAAFEMPIVCDGTTLPGSDVPVPTNTKALDILRDAGVETGMAPARKGRAPRTPSGDGADAAFETALTLLTEQLSAIAETTESPVDLDKHGAALLTLRDLINTLEI